MTVSGTPLPLGTVSQTWSYNLLGLLNSYSPPRRSIDPDLTATLSYSNGLPVGLSVGAQSLVSAATYQPHGGLASWTAGNSVTTTIQQDLSLLPRPLRIFASSFDTGNYAYDGAGNIKAMGLDSFSYDSRSRLTFSTVLGQALSYGYDRYGNLNAPAINPSSNRFWAGTYDARGNLTEYLGQRYDYDGLSRQTALNGGYERYLYDGVGERIARVTSPGAGADFYTISACRLLDTRPVPLNPAVARVIQVAGNCGVPAEATGVSGNLTAVSPSAGGLLNLFPTGTNPQTSSLNYRTALTRANNFALGLSGNGQLTLITSAATDALLDLSGYMRFPDPNWTVTFRDESSRLSTDYTLTSSSITRAENYFYFGNLLVATRDAGVNYLYYASDHLGTPRLVTNAFGSPVESHTYQPFGQEIAGGFGNQPIKFAAMERDLSSLNDYDHARYCSPLTGRFLGPDILQGHPDDPQSWNRYTYALNNPIRYTDPFGLFTFQIVESTHDPQEACRKAIGRPCDDTGTIVTGEDPEKARARRRAQDVLFGLANRPGSAEPWSLSPRAQQILARTGQMAGPIADAAEEAAEFLLPQGPEDVILLALTGGWGRVGRLAGVAGLRVTFGHGARHLAGTGLSKRAVEAAIGAAVAKQAGLASSTGRFWGKVVVEGKTIIYRAYTRAEGVINVGTYYLFGR